MYFENKLEEEIFAKALALLNQLYGGAKAQEEHFENKRKNLVVLNGNKIPIESEKENLRKSTTTKGVDEMKIQGITIHKNKSCNTWYTRYRKDGIQHYISAKTQKECYEKLKKELNIIKKQKPTTYTLQSWHDKWLELYKIGKIKERTLQSYNYLYKDISERLLKKEINKITALDIEENLLLITNKRQKQKVYELLKDIFDKAEKRNIIKSNPLKQIEKPKYESKHGQAMNIKEQKTFINICKKSKFGELFLTILYQGLRKGEALALTIKDIDFNQNTITINKSWNRENKFDTTKNKNSIRTIPLFKSCKELLENYIKTCYTENKEKRIFKCSLKQSDIFFKNIITECNFKNHFRIHDLRHTFVTNLKNINIPEHIIQSIVGHVIGSKITSQIYTHINNEEILKNTDIINTKFYSDSTQKKED